MISSCSEMYLLSLWSISSASASVASEESLILNSSPFVIPDRVPNLKQHCSISLLRHSFNAILSGSLQVTKASEPAEFLAN